MQSSTVSMLLPGEKCVQYYESFVLQYSLIVSSNLFIYDLIDRSSEDQIQEFFDGFQGRIDDYGRKSVFLKSMGIQSNAPQLNETRGLLLDKLFLSMVIDKISPKNILVSFINAKEFLLLYATFEGVLKTEFESIGVLAEGKFLKGKDIPDLLKKKFGKGGCENLFFDLLSERSPLRTYEEIEIFWNFFTHFRHLYFHSGGYVTAKWLNKFVAYKEKLIDAVCKISCPISSTFLEKTIGEINAREGKMFYVEDGFSNVFRNFIVCLMEAMYLAESK